MPSFPTRDIGYVTLPHQSRLSVVFVGKSNGGFYGSIRFSRIAITSDEEPAIGASDGKRSLHKRSSCVEERRRRRAGFLS